MLPEDDYEQERRFQEDQREQEKQRIDKLFGDDRWQGPPIDPNTPEGRLCASILKYIRKGSHD